MYTIKALSPSDAQLLENPAKDVFDYPTSPTLAAEFLADPRHHIVVALDNEIIIGFVSAVHYIHPDKPMELWINEVAVSPAYHNLGIGKAMMKEMLVLGHRLGCKNAWVLTEHSNIPANKLYQSVGGFTNSDETVMYEFKIDQGVV